MSDQMELALYRLETEMHRFANEMRASADGFSTLFRQLGVADYLAPDDLEVIKDHLRTQATVVVGQLNEAIQMAKTIQNNSAPALQEHME